MHEKLGEDACDGTNSKPQRTTRHLSLRASPSINIRVLVDSQPAHGHAKHGKRNGHEREVVPHRHAKDACDQDLVHQSGKRD